MKTMKKSFILLFILSFFFGCEEGIFESKEWDVCPVDIDIYVTDHEGQDLLSAFNPNNILNQDIKIVYEGVEYLLGVDMTQELTRAYKPTLRGLHLYKIGNENLLRFGELDGAETRCDHFEIHWEDGSKDEIDYERDFKWVFDGSPKVMNECIYLNQKKMDKIVIIR